MDCMQQLSLSWTKATGSFLMSVCVILRMEEPEYDLTRFRCARPFCSHCGRPSQDSMGIFWFRAVY
jgi:hypothetical protein